MKFTVTTCPAKTLWLASTNAIVTLCPWRQSGDVDRVVVARIRPPPGQIVDGDVQMPDAWRYVEGARPEHLCDAHVLHAILRPEDTQGQPLGSGASTISLGTGSFSTAT